MTQNIEEYLQRIRHNAINLMKDSTNGLQRLHIMYRQLDGEKRFPIDNDSEPTKWSDWPDYRDVFESAMWLQRAYVYWLKNGGYIGSRSDLQMSLKEASEQLDRLTSPIVNSTEDDLIWSMNTNLRNVIRECLGLIEFVTCELDPNITTKSSHYEMPLQSSVCGLRLQREAHAYEVLVRKHKGFAHITNNLDNMSGAFT